MFKINIINYHYCFLPFYEKSISVVKQIKIKKKKQI